jgi:hemolysin activation/secretion protein
VNYNKRLEDDGFYSQYLSEFSFYITPNIPYQLTFAGRIGGAMNFGDFEFYQANTLGSVTGLGYGGGNLRGFRKTRFVGDKIFYQNAEVRLQLLRFNTYIFPGKFGVLGLFDNGRVWAENEISKKWHMGYGGGIWIDFFHRLIMTATYSLSDEDRVFNFRLGFFF